jgi:hypothetical protein
MTENGQALDRSFRLWILVRGSRAVVSGALIAGIVAISALLISAGVVYVGPGSNLATTFGSGLLSGLLTLVTVALSINQLILSRLFGAPSGLTDDLDASVAFRSAIERTADVPVSPTDPGQFIALLGETLVDSVEPLAASGQSDELAQLGERLVEYGHHLETVGESDDPFALLSLTLDSSYATHIAETRRLRAVADDLAEDDEQRLTNVLSLLKAMGTMRQFFKTLVLQQDLALLSRHLIYTGVPAVLTAYYLSAVYTASPLPPSIAPGAMPIVVSVATGVMLAPLVVLVVYLLRVATVALYTASVGPFVPPLASVEE